MNILTHSNLYVLYYIKKCIGFNETKKLGNISRVLRKRIYYIDPSLDDVINIMRIYVPLEVDNKVDYLCSKSCRQYNIMYNVLLKEYKKRDLLKAVILECSRIYIDKKMAKKLVNVRGVSILAEQIELNNKFTDRVLLILAQLVNYNDCYNDLVQYDMLSKLILLGSKTPNNIERRRRIITIIESWVTHDLMHQAYCVSQFLKYLRCNNNSLLYFSLRSCSTIIPQKLGYLFIRFGIIKIILNLLDHELVCVREQAILSITNLSLDDNIEKLLVEYGVITKLSVIIGNDTQRCVNHAAAALYNLCHQHSYIICNNKDLQESLSICYFDSIELSDLRKRIRDAKIKIAAKKIFSVVLKFSLIKK